MNIKLYITIATVFVILFGALTIYTESVKSKLEKAELKITALENEIDSYSSHLAFVKSERARCGEELNRQNAQLALYEEKMTENVKLLEEEKKSIETKYNALQSKYSDVSKITCEEKIRDIDDVYKLFFGENMP